MPDGPNHSRGAGGTEGGIGMFIGGAILAAAGLYFLLDSIHMTSGNAGAISGGMRQMMGGAGGGGMWTTTSMGVLFVPFVIGVAILFYDASKRTGWVLTVLGLAIIIIEALSRIRFVYDIKTTHALLILVMIAAGTGLILRSLKDSGESSEISE